MEDLEHYDLVLNMLRIEEIDPKERLMIFLYYLRGLDNVVVTAYSSTYIMHMDYIRVVTSMYEYVKKEMYGELCSYLHTELIEYSNEILQYRTRNAMIDVLEKIL